MRPPAGDFYSAREIALAAGVSERDVIAVIGPTRRFVAHDEAVRVGRMLASSAPPTRNPESAQRIPQQRLLPITLSTTMHAAMTLGLALATFGLTSRAAPLRPDNERADSMRLVFLASPGPGGGGGGGGLLQRAPAPKILREGRRPVSSPLPRRVEPKPIEPAPAPPEPKPQPLKAEQLPVVVAPIVSAPADSRNRVGVLAETTVAVDSHGPGSGGGAGTGKGTGLGQGDGSGVGPGSGGGTGGGPYRPGSGVEPPRLLQEVKASYTEDARRLGISGDVELEIVVRRDGTVGDVRILRGLGGGLNDRAVQAVRQWRFSPAHRLGAAVDVVVEVSVEFKLR